MKFPKLWKSLGMWPDELSTEQVSRYVEGNENGCEHDRNEAFHWWIRRSPDATNLDKLICLAAVDPLRPMALDVIRCLSECEAFNDTHSALCRSLFQSRPVSETIEMFHEEHRTSLKRIFAMNSN
jgi:hypothetical protein